MDDQQECRSAVLDLDDWESGAGAVSRAASACWSSERGMRNPLIHAVAVACEREWTVVNVMLSERAGP